MHLAWAIEVAGLLVLHRDTFFRALALRVPRGPVQFVRMHASVTLHGEGGCFISLVCDHGSLQTDQWPLPGVSLQERKATRALSHVVVDISLRQIL